MTRDTELEKLLDGAKRVARYGQGAGLLTGPGLAQAIADADGKADLAWSDGEAVKLQDELSRAMRDIRPMTLADLRDWDPFHEPQRKVFKWYKAFFIMVVLVMILICANMTLWHKTAVSFISQVSAAEKELEAQALDDLIDWVVQAETPRRAPGELVTFISGSVDTLKDTLARSVRFRERYTELMKDRNPIRTRYVALTSRICGNWPSFCGRPDVTKSTAFRAQSYSLENAGLDAASCEADLTQLLVDMEKIGDLEGGIDKSDMLIYAAQFKPRASQSVSCIAGLEGLVQKMEADKVIFENQKNRMLRYVELYGRWYLPALYGALGALLFTMRSFLNPVFPDPPFLTVVLRVVLGSFAGVVLGWFMTPELSQSIGSISGVRLSLLTIAFLCGFGIDVFFAFFDRLVSLAHSWVSQIGRPSS
ncbi:MAG: hypothetical protein ACPGNV_05275 [Mangrovicoccus sp.]